MSQIHLIAALKAPLQNQRYNLLRTHLAYRKAVLSMKHPHMIPRKRMAVLTFAVRRVTCA